MTSEKQKAADNMELFYAILKSIDAFDEIEVRGVVHALLSPTLEEQCVIATYDRAFSNVKSLLDLNHVKHFQAIGMLARSLFELTVDIKLVGVIERAPLKMLHFKDVEKLKACKSAVDFESANPLTYLPNTDVQKTFISKESQRIKNVANTLWPTPLNRLSHWSEMNLPQRVKLLDPNIQEMYACFYRQLSWNVHAGLQGVMGLKPETFVHMCGMSFNLAARVYEMLITSVVKTFRLATHDPSLENKMKFARYITLTENAEDELTLRRELNL